VAAADCTDKKDNYIFLIYKEIQTGAVAMLNMRKGFLISEEMLKYSVIFEEPVSHIEVSNRSRLNSLYMKKIYFSF
jgi:hypothetical protein